MTSDQLEHFNLVQLVCSRPKMFTINGSLAEILALIMGYDMAIRRGERANDSSAHQVLKWLNSEIRPPRNLVDGLLDRYSTEEAALAAIQEYASDL